MDSSPYDTEKMPQWMAVAPAPVVRDSDLRFSPTAFEIQSEDGESTLLDRVADDDRDRWIIQESDGRQFFITEEQARYSYFPEYIDQRTIRVFISSTFRDMHVERSYLVTTVFPRLKRLARSMGLQFQEIDLRWGISSEDARNGKTVAICLNEIDRCRKSPPFFIGILGERYGWIPDPVALKDIEREMSIYRNGDSIQSICEAASQNSYSVTEMEMRYGVLEAPGMQSHSFFYARAPELTDMFAGSAAQSCLENIYRESSSEVSARQVALKNELRERGLIRIDGYRSVEELGNDIERAISAAINRIARNAWREVTQLSSPPPLEWDRNLAWSASLARDHIDLSRVTNTFQGEASWSDFNCLNKVRILMVGEPGSGKAQESVAMAQFLVSGNMLLEAKIVPLHCRISSISNSDAAISYVMTAIASFGGIVNLEKAARLDALESVEGYFVVLVTDIDSLYDCTVLIDFISLVKTPKLAFVLSCTDSRFGRYAFNEFTLISVDELNSAAREKFIVQYLSRYRKSLDRAQLARLLDCPMSGSPLFLTLVLDNVRQSSVFETLTADVGRFYSFENLEQVLIYSLKFWRGCMGLSVSQSVSFEMVLDALCVSYYGVPEEFIFSSNGANLSPLQWATWCGLADSVIADVGGYWRFSSNKFKEIVSSAGCDSAEFSERQMKSRRSLAAFIGVAPEYTDGIGLHERVQQLFWLVKNASDSEDADGLYLSLSQPDNVCRLHVIDHALLFEGWRFLVQNGYSIASLLKAEVGDKNDSWDTILFELLTEFGCWSELEQAVSSASAHMRHSNPMVLEYNLGVALVNQARYSEAIETIAPRLAEWACSSDSTSSVPPTFGLLIGLVSDGNIESAPWSKIIDCAIGYFTGSNSVSRPYDDAALIVGLVNFLFRNEQYDLAAELVGRGVSLSYSLREPFGSRIRLMLGFPFLCILRMQGKLDETIILGQSILDESCEPFQSHLLFRARCCRAMGQTSMDLQKWHDALPLLEYALEHEPQGKGDFIPLVLISAFMVKTLMELGDFTRMNTMLESYAHYFSGSPELALQLRPWLLQELLGAKQLRAYEWLEQATPSSLA